MTGYSPWLAEIAAFGLAGADATLPVEPLHPREWTRLTRLVRHQRIQGLLLQAVSEDAFPVTAAQRQEAIDLHVEAMVSVLVIERRMLEVVDLFDAEGLEHRVLKGSACAHAAYASPSLRVFGDADLLVRTDDWDHAVSVLLDAGYARRRRELSPGFDRRFGKGATLVGPERFQLDLHRTLVHPPFGLQIDLAGLFSTATPFAVGERTLLGLGREERCLHACYHAALGNVPPRLVPLRDVAEHVLDPLLDHDRVLSLARTWQGAAVVALAVRTAWETLRLADSVPVSVWAHRYEPDAGELRALSCYVGEGRSYGRKVVATLRSLPGLREKAALLMDLGFPDRRYLKEQGATYAGWWQRGRRALTSAARGTR